MVGTGETGGILISGRCCLAGMGLGASPPSPAGGPGRGQAAGGGEAWLAGLDGSVGSRQPPVCHPADSSEPTNLGKRQGTEFPKEG